MNIYGVPYYEVSREKVLVVVPALGHLYTVSAETRRRSSYPIFKFRWAPRFLAERGADRTRVWLRAIRKLSREADAFIDACDYDMEGSLIGYSILKYACGNKEKVSRRMRYSTLTLEELERSYSQSLPHLDFALIEAGRTRHEVDWLYGINLSRALTTAARKSTGRYRTLSTGRVQGPLLRFLVSREKSIRSFVPTPYWRVRANVEIAGQKLSADYWKRMIETRRQADAILQASRGRGKVEKVDERLLRKSAPAPFDLGALQVEAYNLLGYSPKSTLDAAQHLYLEALISYPRTSSQRLPPAIDYRSILEKLNRSGEYRLLTEELLAKAELKPHEGSHEDPAHPAIYPTGNLPGRLLSHSERSIFDLIVRRFMAVFGDPVVKQNVRISITIKRHSFYLTVMRTMEQGWQRFYESYIESKEALLPLVKEDEPVDFKKVTAEEKFTEPPPRYTPSSLLLKMEEVGIGTKATRADAIQRLYQRKYVRNDRMVVTDLGLEVLGILRSHCPKVVSPELTREIEERMNGVCQGRETERGIVASTIEILKPTLKTLKDKEEEIGEQLGNAIEKTRLQESIIGACPICRTGELITVRSKKTHKRFIGCTNYFKGRCTTSFPLPQKGAIKMIGSNCRRCGWPILQVRTGGKRVWTYCFNPDCRSRDRACRN